MRWVQLKVSVIVPVYNTEKYLEKCLSSLVNQTLDEIEIVAIDDGSTDKSSEILDEYAQKFPSKFVVRHKENGGQATARNLALTLCTGDFIGFLDSDDFVEENMFKSLYDKAIENDADYVGCAYKDLFDSHGNFIVLQEYVGNIPCSNNREMYLNGAKVSPFINFYRRSLIIDNEIQFTEGFIYEDTAFWGKIVPFIKKPVYVEEALACRVRHENSTTTIIKAEKVCNIFPVISDLIAFYKRKNLFEEYYSELEYFCVRVLLCSSLERVSRVVDRQKRKYLLDETFNFINKHFKNYKRNKYLNRGTINTYIRFSNKFLCKLLIAGLRLKKNKQ